MILSHRHRFIFIKGLKVAGTSAEIALSQICGPDDIVTPITAFDERLRLGTPGEPRNYLPDRDAERSYLRALAKQPVGALADTRAPRGPFDSHMPLANVLALVPEASDYRLLFVERSPYEKVISQANWRAHRRRYEEGRGLPDSPKQLGDLVQHAIDDGAILKVRNIERYRDANGRIRAPGWRYERLCEDIAAFIADLGLAPVPLVHAKRGLETSRFDAAAILRPEQIAFVDREFEEEFRTFGFPVLQ